MAKTGPLGKAESFYVEEKYKSGDTVEQIAHDLDRATTAIEKHLKKAKIEAPRTIIDQQFVRQNGSVVMTENASSMIDHKKNNVPKKQSNCITKIR